MEQFQRGSNDVIPVPVEFEKGIALLAVQADQTGRNRPGTGVQVPLINAKIITKSGKGFLLYPGTDASADPTDPSNPFPPRPPVPKPTTEATPDTPDAPPAPASETPAEPTEEPQSP
jgi:hypothetical protein